VSRSTKEVNELCEVLEDFFQEHGFSTRRSEATEGGIYGADVSGLCMLTLSRKRSRHRSFVYVQPDRLSIVGYDKARIAEMLERRLAGDGFGDFEMMRTSGRKPRGAVRR